MSLLKKTKKFLFYTIMIVIIGCLWAVGIVIVLSILHAFAKEIFHATYIATLLWNALGNVLFMQIILIIGYLLGIKIMYPRFKKLLSSSSQSR